MRPVLDTDELNKNYLNNNHISIQKTINMRSFTHQFLQSGRFLVMICFLAIGFVSSAQEQIPKQQGRCSAAASQIYFVEDGQSRLDVYPSAPRGYQLNILGSGVDNFEVIQENFISSVSVIPFYTSPTSAKWQINFAANYERVICSIKMKNKCTGEILYYPLTVGVRLFNR